ncbi:hypothetical protein IV87_GL000103 [Pediococcus ethanolidurans]|uniref:SIS domain-containing protein n=1 Tax=Pediococcus ethanolidurans TaxID=319653 RepID=A0A0R2K203_9LACO|nr:hypothetical protein IV87_GL000103 [Pediococcus ethanolidurans]
MRQYVKEKKKRAISEAIDETALISFLHQTTEEFIGNRIQEASKELIDKEIIIFLGWGASKIIADYGAYYFSSIFNFSLSVANPLANPISNISGETAKKVGIIAMSMSGESPKVIRNLEYFTDLGTTIVSITNSDKNSISNISDVNIPIYVSIEMNLTADITSHVPAIFLIEKLAKNIAILQKSS